MKDLPKSHNHSNVVHTLTSSSALLNNLWFTQLRNMKKVKIKDNSTSCIEIDSIEYFLQQSHYCSNNTEGENIPFYPLDLWRIFGIPNICLANQFEEKFDCKVYAVLYLGVTHASKTVRIFAPEYLRRYQCML